MAILSSHDLNICCTNMNCRYFKNGGDKTRHYKTPKICQTIWGAARAVRKCLWGLWAEQDLLGTSRRWRTPQSPATASRGRRPPAADQGACTASAWKGQGLLRASTPASVLYSVGTRLPHRPQAGTTSQACLGIYVKQNDFDKKMRKSGPSGLSVRDGNQRSLMWDRRLHYYTYFFIIRH